MRKTANHHDGTIHRVCNPRQSAAEPDKKFRVIKHVRPVHNRQVAREIFGRLRLANRELVRSFRRVLVDAKNPIAQTFQVIDNNVPAVRIKPAFFGSRRLHGDTNIRLVGDGRRGRFENFFYGIKFHAQINFRHALNRNHSRIDGQNRKCAYYPRKKESRVIFNAHAVDLLKFGIKIRRKFAKRFRQENRQFATRSPFKFRNRRNRGHRVAQDKSVFKRNEHRLIRHVEFVFKNFYAVAENFNVPTDEKFFYGNQLHVGNIPVEKNLFAVRVAYSHVKISPGNFQTQTEIEIETQAVNARFHTNRRVQKPIAIVVQAHAIAQNFLNFRRVVQRRKFRVEVRHGIKFARINHGTEIIANVLCTEKKLSHKIYLRSKKFQ